MKNIVLALLFVTIVLFVAVESHGRKGQRRWPPRVNHGRPWFGGNHGRPVSWNGENYRRPGSWNGGNHGKPGHNPCNQTEPPRNCSVFVNGTCLECEEGFALETRNFSRRPDHRPYVRPHRWTNHPKLESFFPPRPRKSAGNGANFHGCNKTMKTISFCVPCIRYLKIIDPEKCRHGGCGPGCTNCSSPGVCIECKQDMKLYTPPNSNSTQCIPPICEPNVKPTTSAVKPTIEEGEPVILEP